MIFESREEMEVSLCLLKKEVLFYISSQVHSTVRFIQKNAHVISLSFFSSKLSLLHGEKDGIGVILYMYNFFDKIKCYYKLGVKNVNIEK